MYSRTAPNPQPASRLAVLAAGPVPLLLLGLYCTLMALQLVVLAPSGRADDTEALLLSQALRLGYESKNPPLFYWLAHFASEATGTGLRGIYALRMLDLFLFHAGLLALARRVQPDPVLALCAGFAMLATVHFHWTLLYFITNTGLAAAIVPWTVIALFHLRDRPRAANFALFGMLLGLGMLARYNFAIFALALAGAVLLLPDWRGVFSTATALATPAAILITISPHAIWLATRLPDLGGRIGTQLGATPETPYLERILAGGGNLVEGLLAVLAVPLGLMLLAAFPRGFRRLHPSDAERRAHLSLIGTTLALSLAPMIVWVLAGASTIKPHYLIFTCLLPIWLIGRLDPELTRPSAAPAFLTGLGVLVIAAAFAFRVGHYSDAAECDTCEEFQPMARYAETVRASGFETGTILTLSPRYRFPGIVLAAEFPGSRVVSPHYPLYRPPARASGGDCLIVWGGLDGNAVAAELESGAPIPGLGLPLPKEAELRRAEAPLHLANRPAQGMGFVVIKGGLGDCH